MNPVPLSQIGKIVTGKTPKTSREDFFGGDIPFVTPSDMDTRRVISQTARTLSEEGLASVKNSVVPAGAVMVSCIGSDMGKTYLAGKRSVTNQQINTVIVDERRFSPLYIYYNLFGRRKELREKAAGAAQPILNKTEFGKIVVDVPNLAEQREIASILGALDDKIELNRRMAATLEEMVRALYRSWFVDFDPVKAKAEGLAPAFMDEATAALFPNRFGDDGLPEGWELTTIGAVADIVGGATPSTKAPEYWDDGMHAWATPRDLSGLSDTFLIETSRKITDQGLARIGSGLSPAGSMLLSSRAPIGYRVIARIPVAVNQGFIVIRETETITGIEAYLWCEINSETILSNANGSTFQEISKKNFRPIPYILGDAPVRQAFDQMVRPMFERLATLSEENRDLADLRDTLLPKLMSGELRVGEARDQIEEVA